MTAGLYLCVYVVLTGCQYGVVLSGCSIVPTPLALFQSSNGFAPASVLGWLLKFTGNTLLRAPFCQLPGLPSTHSTPFTYFRAKKRKV